MRKTIRFIPAILTLAIASACVSTGGGDWELLGRKEVSFIVERDTIEVGRAEGRFHALKLVVEGAPVEMRDIRVTFGDGSTFHPETRLNFAANSVSRTIDTFYLNTTEDVTDRLFFQQRRVEIGVQYSPYPMLEFRLAGGYAWDQEFSTS